MKHKADAEVSFLNGLMRTRVAAAAPFDLGFFVKVE
jgi:hypothetical protein